MGRTVTRTRKDPGDGTITALCHPGSSWSPRRSADAIRDIEDGIEYTAVGPQGRHTGIHVVNGPNGKYLRTDWDQSDKNNLKDLPNC